MANFFLGLLGLCAVIGYTVVNGWQASLTAQSVALAQKQFEASERPWISLDLSTLIVTDPLTFKSLGGFVTIGGEMKNTGHSVAIHVQSNIKIMDWSQVPKNAQMHTARLCTAPISPDQTVGDILFPGDREPIRQGAEFYPKDIAYALTHSFIKGRVGPLAVVCIQYQNTFDSTYHLTQYVFMLLKPPSIGFYEPNGIVSGVYLSHAFFGDWAE